jgi:hypothetical protein
VLNVIVSDVPSGTTLCMPREGIVNDCVHPLPVVFLSVNVTDEFALTVKLLGVYPYSSILITGLLFACSEFVLVLDEKQVGLSRQNALDKGLLISIFIPARTKELFKLKIAKVIIANAAKRINVCFSASPSLVAKYPSIKNKGDVPKTNEKRIAPPNRGFPDAIDKAIIACVVPHGIKTVNPPKTAGAKISPLFDFFLIKRVKK